MMETTQPHKNEPWAKRWVHAVAHSIKLRLVLVFLLLAVAMTGVFIVGAQRAFTLGWKEAARPVVMDYVDRLASDVTGGGATPQVALAKALTKRLPLTVYIQGPSVQWESHPGHSMPYWLRERWDGQQSDPRSGDWGGGQDWQNILKRSTADGHTIVFGIDESGFQRRSRNFGVAIAALLVVTLLAWLYVRRLLRPLDAIGEGAKRFGAGNFNEPIAMACKKRPDELSQLADVMNTMGQDIQQMLDAKRGLLLAISHELRSPLTRARLNTELLPEAPEIAPQRDALMRDLQAMATLISDLLESERLTMRHAVLHRELVLLESLAREVVIELQAHHTHAASIVVTAQSDFPPLRLDAVRMRLLLRNLLDNALRHSGSAPQPASLCLSLSEQGVEIEVRDRGPGVHENQIPHLAEPFYRPDSARSRHVGGVGLGLYLCKLVAQAHGGTFAVSNASPGLLIKVFLPVKRLPDLVKGGV